MQLKSRFYIIIFVVFSLFIFQGVINYIKDPYGIFNREYINYKYHPNLNYVKTNYILNNKTKYDSFIFGSSRVGTLNPKKISESKYYNMSISSGVIKEELEILKIFLENDIKIKEIILGIDNFYFFTFPETHLNDFLRMPYVKLKNKKERLKIYLTIPFYKYRTLIPNSYVKFDINNTGMFIWGEIYFDGKNETSKAKLIRKEKTLKEIEEFITLCQERKIELKIIFTPQFRKNEISDSLDREYEEVRELVKNMMNNNSVYDFTSMDKISRDYKYWYDSSHTKPEVGNIILDEIFKK